MRFIRDREVQALRAVEGPMSDEEDKKKKKGKGDEAGEGTVTVSIAAHPRAKAGIRRARTRAALLAFVLVLVLNLLGDQTLFDAVWRALLAGKQYVAMYMAAFIRQSVCRPAARARQHGRIDRSR